MPTGLSPAEDRRNSCFFMGKRGLCNPVRHQLKRQTGKHFHEVTCADGGATSGASQLRSAKKWLLFRMGLCSTAVAILVLLSATGKSLPLPLYP